MREESLAPAMGAFADVPEHVGCTLRFNGTVILVKDRENSEG